MPELPEIWEKGYEVEELLGKRPSWITRWGILLFLALMLIFVLGSRIIRYPDVLVSPVVLTSENPPATLVSKVDAKINGLYVKDSQQVCRGQLLLQFENPASVEDVAALETFLASYSTDSSWLIKNWPLQSRQEWVLGDIQASYNDLRKSVNDYTQFLYLQEFPVKVKALLGEKKLTQTFIKRLKSQAQVMDKDVWLVKKQHSRDSLLHAQKVLAQSDYEKSESSYLQKKYSLEGTQVTLAQANIQLSVLEQEILDQSVMYKEKKNTFLSDIEKNLQETRNQVRSWRQRYLLVSPVDGIVSLNQYWSLYQAVKQGEKVLTVVPPGKNRIIGKISLGGEGAGKVKAGQRVNIKFVNYPYLEFGTVPALVKQRSVVPQDQKYAVEVIFPEGLTTNYGKKLEYQPEMIGTAEIITEEISLLERMVNPFRYLIRRH